MTLWKQTTGHELARQYRAVQGTLNGTPHLVDCKLDFLTKKVEVWKSDGYTFLHFGRSLPSEELGIMLDGRVSAAWKELGRSGKLLAPGWLLPKVVSRGEKWPGSSRETRNFHISALSLYALTPRTPPGKIKLTGELQDAVKKVPQSDMLLLLAQGFQHLHMGISMPVALTGSDGRCIP